MDSLPGKNHGARSGRGLPEGGAGGVVACPTTGNALVKLGTRSLLSPTLAHAFTRTDTHNLKRLVLVAQERGHLCGIWNIAED